MTGRTCICMLGFRGEALNSVLSFRDTVQQLSELREGAQGGAVFVGHADFTHPLAFVQGAAGVGKVRHRRLVFHRWSSGLATVHTQAAAIALEGPPRLGQVVQAVEVVQHLLLCGVFGKALHKHGVVSHVDGVIRQSMRQR